MSEAVVVILAMEEKEENDVEAENEAQVEVDNDEDDEESSQSSTSTSSDLLIHRLELLHDKLALMEHLQEKRSVELLTAIVWHLEPILFLCFLSIIYLMQICGVRYRYLFYVMFAIVTMPRLASRFCNPFESELWSGPLLF